MKKNEKIIAAGVGAILVYYLLQEKKEKKLNVPNMSISPAIFYTE